ncbi:MAG: DNA repair protein RadC [Clostridiales bacterium]|nr:DNA repair protein RadC [Clostridiales bacterium]
MHENINILDFPSEERPIEKLLLFGPESLNNTELLAIILGKGTKGDNAISLSEKIISKLGGINNIIDVNYNDVTSIKGVKRVKASQIIALGELFKRFNALRANIQKYKIQSPIDVSKLLMAEMSSLNQEILKLLVLNSKSQIIKVRDVFKGTLNTSIVHPREIFKEAIKHSGASIIICHNHPSGDPTPSQDDINITRRIKESGKIIGIELIDHIIIGENKYISLKEQGII